MRFFLAVTIVLLAVVPAAAQGFTMRVSGDIVVPRDTVQQGTAMTMNGRIQVDGTLRGDAITMNGDVVVSGTVTGSIRTFNGSVSLAPTAHVGGDVWTANGRIDQAPGAEVRGRISQGIFRTPPAPTPSPPPLPAPAPRPWEWQYGWWWPGMLRAVATWTMVGFIVLAAVITSLFPRPIRHVAEALAQVPGESLLAGIVLWILLPPLALALVVSVVGIPVVAFLPLAVMIIGLIGFGGTVMLIGERIVGAFQGQRSPALEAVVGAVLLGICAFIPGLGWLIVLLALTWGIGGVVMLVLRRLRGTPTPPPTTG